MRNRRKSISGERARIVSAEKIASLIGLSTGKTLQQMRNRLSVALRMLHSWYDETADQKEHFWPMLDLTRYSVEEAYSQLKRGDSETARAQYSRAGRDFQDTWGVLSQSTVAPTLLERAGQAIEDFADTAKKVATVFDTSAIIMIVLVLVFSHASKE